MGHTFYSIHLHNTSIYTYMHCQYAVGRTRCAIIVSYCVYYYKNCVYSTESHTNRSNQTGPDRSHCNSVCCRILNYVNDFSKRKKQSEPNVFLFLLLLRIRMVFVVVVAVGWFVVGGAAVLNRLQITIEYHNANNV